jgi:hypothetical protein
MDGGLESSGLDWNGEKGVVGVEASSKPDSDGTSGLPCFLRARVLALSRTTPSSKEPYAEL